jgi:hypothetical protein
MKTEYRFELEERIMDCWHVVNDIRVVQTLHQDVGELSVDDMSIILMGIQKLYGLKFQWLYEVFEKHLRALHVDEAAKNDAAYVLNTKIALLEDEVNRLRGEK